MKFSIKDFFSKCDQIRRRQWIWWHLLKKPLMENFIFCAVKRNDIFKILEECLDSTDNFMNFADSALLLWY